MTEVSEYVIDSNNILESNSYKRCTEQVMADVEPTEHVPGEIVITNGKDMSWFEPIEC